MATKKQVSEIKAKYLEHGMELEAPIHINERARSYYFQFAGFLIDQGMLAECDLPLVEICAYNFDQYQTAQVRYEIARDVKEMREWSTLMGARQEAYMKAANQLGFSPAARSRSGSAVVIAAKKKSKHERGLADVLGDI